MGADGGRGGGRGPSLHAKRQFAVTHFCILCEFSWKTLKSFPWLLNLAYVNCFAAYLLKLLFLARFVARFAVYCLLPGKYEAMQGKNINFMSVKNDFSCNCNCNNYRRTQCGSLASGRALANSVYLCFTRHSNSNYQMLNPCPFLSSFPCSRMIQAMTRIRCTFRSYFSRTARLPFWSLAPSQANQRRRGGVFVLCTFWLAF